RICGGRRACSVGLRADPSDADHSESGPVLVGRFRKQQRHMRSRKREGGKMKRFIGTLAAGLVIAIGMTSVAAAQELQKLKLGFGTKIVSPMIANILIPEYLGYYRQEGLTLEFFPLGPNTVVMEQIASKRIDFATGVPTVQLPVVARGETLPTIDFYQFTYPFKYGLATN